MLVGRSFAVVRKMLVGKNVLCSSLSLLIVLDSDSDGSDCILLSLRRRDEKEVW